MIFMFMNNNIINKIVEMRSQIFVLINDIASNKASEFKT